MEFRRDMPLDDLRTLAEAGNADAQGEMGRRYAMADGLQRDINEAARWFRLSADGGCVFGMISLAKILENGLAGTVDHDEAFRLFSKAADTGHPEAMYLLGNMYEQGHGTEKNVEKTYELVTRAADIDPRFLLSRARMRLVKGDPEGAYKDFLSFDRVIGTPAVLNNAKIGGWADAVRDHYLQKFPKIKSGGEPILCYAPCAMGWGLNRPERLLYGIGYYVLTDRNIYLYSFDNLIKQYKDKIPFKLNPKEGDLKDAGNYEACVAFDSVMNHRVSKDNVAILESVEGETIIFTMLPKDNTLIDKAVEIFNRSRGMEDTGDAGGGLLN